MENEDPIFTKIREHADVIRYIGQNTQCHPDEAWSKQQVIQMIDEMSENADAILRLTGVANLETHFEDAWASLGEKRSSVTGNGFDAPFQPYAGDGPR